MENYIVETRNLKKYYQQGTNTVKALDGVDFRVKAEEFVAIIGKSGSGKSTLLHMIGGLDVPTSGSVIVGGKNLAGLTKEQLAIFRRRKIGFVFQSYNLVQDLNVYENIILPVELDGKRVDQEAFLSGKTCILYRHGLFGLDEKELRGKQISCEEYVHPENTRTFEIAGMTDVGDYVSLLGFPPTMIVIDDAVKAFTEKPIVFRVGIRYAEEYHKETEDAILSNIEESPNKTDFSWDSKIEQAENVKAAQGHMMEIGFGIVLILGIIGVMNYINTSVGNMQSRQKEISIMESVGMTERQVKKMLVWEGIFYTGGVLFLTLTVGIGITYAIYQTMNYMGAKFWFPALPFLGATLILFVVCIVVPVWTYQKIEKSGSLVERIRVSVE